jgi:hypothetical protein
MPATIFAANESNVQVNGQPIEGVRAVEYQYRLARSSVYALGSAERVGIVSGARYVEGRIRVASTAPVLDQLEPEATFAVLMTLRQGETSVEVAFDDCLLTERSFDINVGAHGEAVYAFTASRVR